MLADVIKNIPIDKVDLHTHSNYCDGKASIEEMVVSAIDKGVKVLGIVTHAYVDFEDFYTIAPNKVGDFLDEVDTLGNKYKDKITLLAGVEADPAASMTYEGFSYVLGSAHYFYKDGKYRSVDADPTVFTASVNELFDGDYLLAAENYFEQIKRVADLKPDIIGHFDLVSKFNEMLHAFDENDPRYVRAWQSAADELMKLHVPFEINTGGISRGWKTTSYPSKEMLAYLKAKGATFVLSSDAHRPDYIANYFDKF